VRLTVDVVPTSATEAAEEREAIPLPGTGRRRRYAPATMARGRSRTSAQPRPVREVDPDLWFGLDSRHWPSRLPTSLALTSVLALALGLPLLAHPSWDPSRPSLLLFPAVGALGARAIYACAEGGGWGGESPSLRSAACASAAGLLVASTPALAGAMTMSPAMVGSAFPLAVATLACATLLRGLELRYRPPTSRLFFIGTQAQYLELATEVDRFSDLRIVGHFNLDNGWPRHLDCDALRRRIDESGPTVLILSGEAIPDARLVAIASQFNLRGRRVRELPGFYEQQFKKVAVSELTPSWFLFDIAEIHRHRVYGRVKRVVETIIAGAILLLTAPLFLFATIAIKLSNPGPVFFRQERVGKDGRRFRLIKFRTMHSDAVLEHGHWADLADARIFPVGRLLRRYWIDELPQLWLVVRGDMSLIGPRPEQPAIVETLQRSMEFYGARHCVRPGVTGWAQINYGYGGTTAGALKKLQYDLFYIKHQSLALDLRIIAATARAVLMWGGR